jgi:hypothetical protein
MHEEKPNVIHLQVHLPGEHLLTWNPNNMPNMPNIQQVIAQAGFKQTTLMAFFTANETYPETHDLLYQDFPIRMTFVAQTKKWKLKERGDAIGRMYYCHPSSGEHFYLCLLLTVVTGSTSFEDLCTFENVVHPTFKGACIARGLLEDDGE